MKREIIYIVQGFETKLETGQLTDLVTVEVYADNEEEAIIKAKTYCKKSFYRVSQVIEK